MYKKELQVKFKWVEWWCKKLVCGYTLYACGGRVLFVVLGNSGVFPLYLERIFYYSIDRVVLFMSSYWVWLRGAAAVKLGPGCVVDVFYWTGIGQFCIHFTTYLFRFVARFVNFVYYAHWAGNYI